MYAAGAIVLIIAALIAIKVVGGSGGGANTATGPVPADVMTALTSVPTTTLDSVGRGSATQPIAIRGSELRNIAGLPDISYIGAEYCPFCAAERWPMIVALSRFGQFSNLSLSHSASDDIYPSTPTFTFVGSSYTSQYVAFDPVEVESNVRQGNGYAQLQTPTPSQQQLLRTYDAAPYVPASSAGSIPFVDFANLYMISGSSFDPGVLQGKTWSDVASSLSQPTSPPAQGILGTANLLTAMICQSTNNQPADVCNDSVIQQLSNSLSQLPAPNQ
jgi:hypothetical protein